MLGDQWYNVEKYVHHNIGLQLDITTLTEEEFKESVTKVIEDKRYGFCIYNQLYLLDFLDKIKLCFIYLVTTFFYTKLTHIICHFNLFIP